MSAEQEADKSAGGENEPAEQGLGQLAWHEWRTRLEQAGFRPSRRLGQNFLVDRNAARAIARSAAVGEGDTVLEVGVGLGFLTAPLLSYPLQRLIAVEIDPRLAELSRQALGHDPRLQWIIGDVLAGKHTLAPAVVAALPASGPWHLVSNLPYAVSGPLLATLSLLENPPHSWTILVQREVAQRILAKAGSGEWGSLAICLQSGYRATLLRELGPTLFRPRPKVMSSLLRLEARSDALPAGLRREVIALARALFLHRRQSLGRALTSLLREGRAASVLAAAGIDAKLRAEALDLAALVRLCQAAGSSFLQETAGPPQTEFDPPDAGDAAGAAR